MLHDASLRSLDDAPTDFVLHLSQRLSVGSNEAVSLLANWVATYEPRQALLGLAEAFGPDCGRPSPPRR